MLRQTGAQAGILGQGILNSIKRQALRATKKACSAFFSDVIAWKI